MSTTRTLAGGMIGAVALAAGGIAYAFSGTGGQSAGGWQNIYLWTERPVLKVGMVSPLHAVVSQVGPGSEVIKEVSGPTGYGANWTDFTGNPNWIHGVSQTVAGTYGYQLQIWNNGVETASSPTIYLTWAAQANSTSWAFTSSTGEAVAAAQTWSAGATADSATLTERIGGDPATTGSVFDALVYGKNIHTQAELYPSAPDGYQTVEYLSTNDTPSWTFTVPAGTTDAVQMTGYEAPNASASAGKATAPYFILGSPSNTNGVSGLYSLGQTITLSGAPPNGQVWVEEGTGGNRQRWFTVLANASGVATVPASRVGSLGFVVGSEPEFWTNIQY